MACAFGIGMQAYPVAFGDELDSPDRDLADIKRFHFRAIDIVPDLDLSVAVVRVYVSREQPQQPVQVSSGTRCLFAVSR
jgi:hypothetical protein